MAESEEAIFNFPAQKLDLIDENLQKTLANCDNQTREDVLEELANEYDVDVLLEERENCFLVARQKLQDVLQSEGTLCGEETLDIKCIRRTGKSTKKAIGKDILDLFQYIVGYVHIFPKHLITKDSKLVNAVPNGDTEE